MTDFIKFEKNEPKYLILVQDESEKKEGEYEGKRYVYYTWECEEGTIKATEKLDTKMKDLNLKIGDKIVIEKKPHPNYPSSVYFAVERYTVEENTKLEDGLDDAKFTSFIKDLKVLIEKYEKVPF